MLTVSLSGIRLTAPIGLYPQEAFTRNEIEINIAVSQKADINDLPLIDYSVLHGFALEAAREPAPLLEAILQRIVTRIESLYPKSKMTVSVRKLNPPMAGETDYSEVKWES